LLVGLAAAAVASCRKDRSGSGTPVAAGPASARESATETGLLNASYDPTREFYVAYNRLFAAEMRARTQQRVSVQQSHGGSAAQARAVLEGLAADVVTLALPLDVGLLAQRGLLPPNWQTRLPHDSSPYTSTIVLLVRRGNPKGIRSFGDLARSGVSVITPNPKTGGGARLNYLAAWGYAERQPGATADGVRTFMRSLLANVAVFDAGARGSSTTFIQRKIGDVLVTWENEAKLALEKDVTGELELVVPPLSILAEPPVSIVDGVVDQRGTRALAEAYVSTLYRADVQELMAEHGYRPRDPQVLARHGTEFPKLDLFTIDAFGGWQKAQAAHFAEGGSYDQLMSERSGH
jgi:sulfate transport system substrate-binding protein